MRQHKQAKTESSFSPEDTALLEGILRTLKPAKKVEKHDEDLCNATLCALPIHEKKELKAILRAIAKEKETTYSRLFCALLFYIGEKKDVPIGYIVVSADKNKSIFPILRSI